MLDERQIDNEVMRIKNEALTIERDNPQKAIAMLKEAINKYPDSWTVQNYILDDCIWISSHNESWDDAIEICEIAQKVKPEFSEGYASQQKSYELEKEGRRVEALEVLFEYYTKPYDGYEGDPDKYVPHFATLRMWGVKFLELGESDRAWRLFNEAVSSAFNTRESPHTVRQEMANQLLAEGKHSKDAVALILTGIEEAETWSEKDAPKSLKTSLSKALRANGIKGRDKVEELFSVAQAKGHEVANARFLSWIENSS